jgi:hypothetical protein
MKCQLCGGERGNINQDNEYGIMAHPDCVKHHYGKKFITISQMKKDRR